MSEWISVKDRLPRLDTVVLICYQSGYDGSAIYAFGGLVDDGDGWLWGISHAGMGIYANDDAVASDVEADDDYQVTHWMPLPEPPKEKP